MELQHDDHRPQRKSNDRSPAATGLFSGRRFANPDQDSIKARNAHRAPVVTQRQRARRLLYWRGSFSAITILSLLMLLGALAGTITQ
jgi:lipopolysaccharide/colanic/teichoic acid biosynthesis glycosyltransferase